MKRKHFALIVAMIVALGAARVRADLEVSAEVRVHAVAEFRAPLGVHGTWIEVSHYGHCWRPAGVAVEWRPYGDGQWIWTDCGWYWASDEPWAWACYHYGWWTLDSTYGWIWVPGVEWAPAWVTWRVGSGFCGWAPLPPHGVALIPTAFAFVEERHFRDRVRPKTLIVNNVSMINKTTVIKGERRETRNIAGTRQKVVINGGPSFLAIEKATGKKLAPVPVQEAARQTRKPQLGSQNAGKSDPVHVPRPEATPRSPTDRQDTTPNRRPHVSGEKSLLRHPKELPKQRELAPDAPRPIDHRIQMNSPQNHRRPTKGPKTVHGPGKEA